MLSMIPTSFVLQLTHQISNHLLNSIQAELGIMPGAYGVDAALIS